MLIPIAKVLCAGIETVAHMYFPFYLTPRAVQGPHVLRNLKRRIGEDKPACYHILLYLKVTLIQRKICFNVIYGFIIDKKKQLLIVYNRRLFICLRRGERSIGDVVM